MKALVYTGVKSLEYRDFADPSPAPGESLIAVDSVGICGSDMHAFLGHDARRPAPLILGHEAAGTIIEGEGKGKRVTVNPLVACGACAACQEGRGNLCPERQIISMPPREGAFAEQLVMPFENLVEVPGNITFEQAALAEPLACGWHAVRLGARALEKPLAEARVVVLGGGAIGLGAALCARAQGAHDIWISEPNTKRHATLKSAGDFQVFDPTRNESDLASSSDLIIDAVGLAPTREAACAMARPGGVIAHIGLGEALGGLDVRRMTLQEITFIGTYTYTPADFLATAQALFDGSLGALEWIDVRPLHGGQKAFEDSLAGQVSAAKIILKP